MENILKSNRHIFALGIPGKYWAQELNENQCSRSPPLMIRSLQVWTPEGHHEYRSPWLFWCELPKPKIITKKTAMRKGETWEGAEVVDMFLVCVHSTHNAMSARDDVFYCKSRAEKSLSGRLCPPVVPVVVFHPVAALLCCCCYCCSGHFYVSD